MTEAIKQAGETMPVTDAMIREYRELLKGATARPWAAFDVGGTLAVMKGKRPPLKDNGYPIRRWPEIVTWMGFDGSDVPSRYRRANLHLIVAAVNALPKLLDEIERLQSARTPEPVEDMRGSEVERALRIAIWNALRERGVKQDACYPIIEGAVAEFKDEVAKAVAAALRPSVPSQGDAGALCLPEPYDAGLLGDGGGGDVSWWRDYICCELDRAHEHYSEQAGQAAALIASLEERMVGLEGALRLSRTWLFECWGWLMETDLDMTCPMQTDPLDIVEQIDALLGIDAALTRSNQRGAANG